ncbi:hypothetical protein BC827DRAFT_80350 [Russula dissimulans]|nr:hypothetical protein BC827DRAFT_80350 [Russula dissimulans]
MSHYHHQVLPLNPSAVIADRLIDVLVKCLPSSQEKRGDRKLELARNLAAENASVISQDDRDVIKERITFARETKIGLDSKSGFSKLVHAREYRRTCKEAYRYAKHVSERGRDTEYFSRRPTISSALHSGVSEPDAADGPEDIFDRVNRIARSLYRCYLSCKDAFPSPDTKIEWERAAWNEACAREGVHPNQLPQDGPFADRSMKVLHDMKMKIMHHIESFYGFDTSRAPEVISRNARHARALLTAMAFIYREPTSGGTPRHPYRHPIIQKAINTIWFQNKDSDGIVFHELFTPIPIQTMALVLTVIECCIDEWTDGTRQPSNWDEARYKAVYISHVSSLVDLRGHGLPQSRDLLAQIQRDLLNDARIHAGATAEPVTGSGRLHSEALRTALQDLHA